MSVLTSVVRRGDHRIVRVFTTEGQCYELTGDVAVSFDITPLLNRYFHHEPVDLETLGFQVQPRWQNGQWVGPFPDNPLEADDNGSRDSKLKRLARLLGVPYGRRKGSK